MKSANNPLTSGVFIPDFCSSRSLWLLVVGVQLIAISLCMFEQALLQPNWPQLALVSLYMQWVALGSAGCLCLLKPALAGWSVWLASGVSCLVIVLLSILVSGVALWAQVVELHQTSMLQFVVKNMLLSLVLGLVLLRYFYMRERGLVQSRSDAEARLNSLQSRIEPHFLFNSLNTVACLISIEPAKAEALLVDLADLFRANLQQAGKSARLDEELELCRRYLHIEQQRLGQRLQVEWDLCDLPDDAQLPLLTLQPLLENAIYHGVAPLLSGGLVKIQGRRLGRRLEFRIENPCLPGLSQGGQGMATNNVRDRLALFFAEDGHFYQEQLPGKYRVWLSFGYRTAT